MTSITWQPVTVALSSLTPWERNPKRISKSHAQRLLDLWQRLGQFQTIAIGPGGEVYDGHQRLSVLKAAHGARFQVQALQSSRALTEKEREELTIAAHVGTTGQFDWEALSGWDAGDLAQWGFDSELLTNWRGDIAALDAMLGSEEQSEDTYSRKIKSPAYEPSGECPEIATLYDDTKTVNLVGEINSADWLTEDEREFLVIAAQRHTVLNFSKIADFYAHASAETQRLMENSALIIIDFDRAIELGYVKLSEEIGKLYKEDYPDD